MDVDHSEFIARHHGPLQKDNRGKGKAKKLLLSLLAFVIYIVGCAVLAMLLNIDETVMTAAALVFLTAAGVAFAFLNFMQGLAMREQERLLVREVLEGSRGCQLITDGGDN